MKSILPVEKRFKHPIGLAVHSILWREWDPIGVYDWGSDDEYDSYVWPIIGKVMGGESADQIADYLDWASNENMGRPQSRDANLATAERLAALRPKSET